MCRAEPSRAESVNTPGNAVVRAHDHGRPVLVHAVARKRRLRTLSLSPLSSRGDSCRLSADNRTRNLGGERGSGRDASRRTGRRSILAVIYLRRERTLAIRTHKRTHKRNTGTQRGGHAWQAAERIPSHLVPSLFPNVYTRCPVGSVLLSASKRPRSSARNAATMPRACFVFQYGS